MWKLRLVLINDKTGFVVLPTLSPSLAVRDHPEEASALAKALDEELRKYMVQSAQLPMFETPKPHPFRHS